MVHARAATLAIANNLPRGAQQELKLLGANDEVHASEKREALSERGSVSDHTKRAYPPPTDRALSALYTTESISADTAGNTNRSTVTTKMKNGNNLFLIRGIAK